MPVAGAKPKPDGQKINRVPPTHDWTEVLNVPYDGEVPSPGRLPNVTKRWWEIICRMPHCVTWTEAQWQFAIDTARVHAMAFGPKAKTTMIAEVRTREKQIGVTADQLRDLRIRYVEPVVETPRDSSTMADFEAERRRRLMEAE